MDKQEKVDGYICNSCKEIRKYLDENGTCLLCKKGHSGGKEIKESRGNYKKKYTREVFSTTGKVDEKKYLR